MGGGFGRCWLFEKGRVFGRDIGTADLGSRPWCFEAMAVKGMVGPV